MLPLLTVENLSKQFRLNGRPVQIIHPLSFSLNPGEIFGLGGESGCGKSTLAKLLLRLIEPSSGSIWFEGKDLVQQSASALKPIRRHMQMVFQNPSTSLNPRMNVEDILYEPFSIHGLLSRPQRSERVRELLRQVGLPGQFLTRLPQELSGGQKQRLAIARAIALEPRLLICDEPFSALDISIQAQLVNLLKELQSRLKLTYLFISHDLAVMRYFTHRIAIMYLGQFVELAPSQSLFATPLHPYTQALIAAAPALDFNFEKKKSLTVLKGDIPSLLHPPQGCAFHTRCPFASAVCKRVKPAWREVSPQHFTACHLHKA
ncbi:ABC transporter ATP-binding protein [Candidatus Protochlamydia phocaeensis]|uniref:ABC transporter ATP-binding protein n=1 Tax=Candidatus Protochlamydia phocaeensis TaxID=1414722 RepID=UPI000838EFAD|nr:ABC transporter ATP-binding protein [Candidatus Protochlamydia phocaeensis]